MPQGRKKIIWSNMKIIKTIEKQAGLFSLSSSLGYVLPWEPEGEGWEYPSSFAPPLQVAIEASDGASDYGNKFGEPVLSGKQNLVYIQYTDQTVSTRTYNR